MLYCLSNAAMPGILKIGTSENVEAMMAGLACADPWRPPAPYEVEFAKKVLNAEAKMCVVQSLLAVQSMPTPGFFRVALEEVRPFFDGSLDWGFLDKEWPPVVALGEREAPPVGVAIKYCRDMAKCFANSQPIRHVVDDSHWVGIFDSSNNTIVREGIAYKSLSGFALAHYNYISPGRRSTVNGWSACEYQVDGLWESTYTIKG